MTALEPMARSLPARSASRILVVTVCLAAAVTLLPALVAAVVPDPGTVVAPGETETIPLPRTPAFRIAAPPGWVESSAPSGPDRPLVWARGTDRISAFASPDVRDADSYAARLVRLATVRDGLVATPDGRASGPDGLTGPRFRVTGSDGQVGDLVVLGRGTSAVGLLSRSDAAGTVDLRPLVDSLRVAS